MENFNPEEEKQSLPLFRMYNIKAAVLLVGILIMKGRVVSIWKKVHNLVI
jgi:hypothetical protein